MRVTRMSFELMTYGLKGRGRKTTRQEHNASGRATKRGHAGARRAMSASRMHDDVNSMSTKIAVPTLALASQAVPRA